MRKVLSFCIFFFACFSLLATDSSTIDFDIPSQFWGSWESEEIDLETGFPVLINISKNDIIIKGLSYSDSFNAYFQLIQEMAQIDNIPYITNFNQTATDTRYEFTILIYLLDQTIIQSMTFKINEDNQRMTIVTTNVTDETYTVSTVFNRVK